MSNPASLLSGRKFARGEVIVPSGDKGTEMFIITQGQAAVYQSHRQPGETKLSALGAGDFFGVMSLFIGKPKTTTLVAVTDVVAIVLDKTNAADFFATQPEFLMSIVTAFCHRADMAANALETSFLELPALNINPPTVAYAPVAPPTPAPAAPAAPAPAAPAARPTAVKVPTAAIMTPAPPPPAPPAAPTPDMSQLPAGCIANFTAVEGAEITGAGHPNSLFLPGHKEYKLPIDYSNNQFLFEKNSTCPQCGKSFSSWAVRQSKLTPKSTDPDRRTRYNGIEPLYFDIITCPDCWFSATSDSFKDGAKRRDQVATKLAPYRAELFFPTELALDTMTVFAGHYLAIECAPICYAGPSIVLGKLWQKLSRIYSDCGDGEMEIKTAQKAHDYYMNAYTKTNVSPRQNQQLCVIIGELSFKLGDTKEARNFFFRAKTDTQGNPVLKRHAEDRIEDVRVYMEKAGITE